MKLLHIRYRYIRYACILLAMATTLAAYPARSTNYSFSHINTNDGLSSSYVKTIHQDKDGFMWFGTKNGLNRYDGKTVKTFDCYDELSHKGNNNIGALFSAPDSTLWVGTDCGIYVYNPRQETFTFVDAEDEGHIYANDWVQDILADNHGNIWVLIPNQGIFRYNGDKLQVYYVTSKKADKDYMPVSLYVTRSGDVYVGTNRDGIQLYDPATDRFHHVKGLASLDGEIVQLIRESFDGNLIICTVSGKLYSYNTITNTLQNIKYSGSGKAYARSMSLAGDQIWLGTQNGIYVISPESEHYLNEAVMDSTGLSDGCIYYLYTDNNDNVWVATMYGGVNYYQRTGFHFDRFTQGTTPTSLAFKRIRGLGEDNRGMLYIGSENNGFAQFNPSSGEFTHFHPGTVSLVIRNFNDTLYLGKSRGGLEMAYDGKLLSTRYTDLHGRGGDNSVYSYLIDNEGNRWIGSDWGVFLCPAGKQEISQVKEMDQCWVQDILQDSSGLIWFASMGDGIWKYNPRTGKYTHYPFDEHHSNGLTTNSVSAVKEDSQGNLWFSTDRGGLVKYDPETDSFLSMTIADGLPDNTVYDLLEDSRGNLWFGTNRGLVKYNPTTASIRVFTTADGLLSNQFNYHSALASRDGWFYFGTLEGLIAFNPEAEKADAHAPQIYFTSMSLDSKEVKAGVEGSPLAQSIFYTDQVSLPYGFSTLSFDVAAPDYSSSGTMASSYRLTPGDGHWHPVSDGKVSFSKLAPGRYTLEVKMDNGISSTTKALKINIRAPWYTTWWAITLLILVIAAVVAWRLLLAKKRQDEKLREKEKLFSINKEKELYENKVQFFTEIAHEIRTPLALIDAPLEAIEELELNDARINKYVKTMRQNTQRLLNLTGQLLDFHKIGANQFTINLSKVDVTALVNETIQRFEPAYTVKGYVLTTSIPSKDIYAVTDAEALTKILSNLLNNALKYGERNVSLVLSSDEKNFKIFVTSDGEKISQEDSLKIFQPFFQLNPQKDNNGVGIGLPLCRTLAHLLHGSIELESLTSTNNTFVLTLPLSQEGFEEEEAPITDQTMAEFVMEDEKPNITETEPGYSLLLVEDNREMREFLSDQLSENFVIDSCANGKEALERLADSSYDIIITDIMMPVMDGYEFCTKVKSDLNRSHIPVVFLTAKNDLESKLKALKCGGEAYIEKPFSIKYFRQQILSLLQNRKHERQAFLKQPLFSIGNMKMTKADEEFMNKVQTIINENLSDENFSVESMADVFCMSRSSLLRKIKTLFNLSPIELIRLVRLKKAAELIQEGKYRIGDVCFMVGINSSSYFSKMFFKQFGLTPKQFEKQCQSKGRAQAAADDEQEE